MYPYLLRNVAIEKPNHVWSTDITYIPMRGGFLYLTAVIDWYSRFILSWEISNSLDSVFCCEALGHALKRWGQPTIFNTDQGSQFTSTDFLAPLKKRDIKISMDGRGRAIDNVYIERFWWSLKYELIYPGNFEDGITLHRAVTDYIGFYNFQRPHQALNYSVPAKRYNLARPVEAG